MINVNIAMKKLRSIRHELEFDHPESKLQEVGSRRLTADEILENYKAIQVKATDGEIYDLAQYFPICLRVEAYPDRVYLDTGGHMDGCDFFQAVIEDRKLIRLCDDGQWRKIGTLIY